MALSSRQEMCREEIKNAPHPASDDRRDADTNRKPSFAVGGALATPSATVAVCDADGAASRGTTRSRFNADGVRAGRMCEW